MSEMIPMEDILNIFKSENNERLNKKRNFIKDVHKICNDIINIINNCRTEDGTIIDFDDTFGYDIRDLKSTEIMLLIQNIDDISSFLLLFTSLLSNYTTKLNYELSYNEMIKYFKDIDIKFKEKIEKPVYNKNRVLRDLRRYEKRLVNSNYRQSKYIMNCFGLFIMLPVINNYKFRSIFNKKFIKLDKFNMINRNLMKMLTSYLSDNPRVYKLFKKYRWRENIHSLKYLLIIFKKITFYITKFLLDISSFIYFLMFGMRNIDKEIKELEEKLVKDYNELRDNTRKIINNINNGEILDDLNNYLEGNNKDFETEYNNETNFSNSSNRYILYADKKLNNIIKNYIHLKKYLYNERDFLNNIKK